MSDLGGVARHVLDVAGHGLPGWDVVFLCPPGPLADRLREQDVEVVVAPFGPEHGLRASVRTMRSVLRRLRPAVVHAHLSYADVVAALVKPRGSVLVTTEHGIAADDAVYHGTTGRARVMALVHRARLRRVDVVLAVSRATAQAMKSKWGAGRVSVVRNGIDRPATDPAPGSAPASGLRLLSLARLAPEKRLPDLIDAFALVAADHADARLTIAGVGELEGALRRQSAALGLSDRIDLPGFLDPAKAMADHDVVAMLSVWENCSYTLLDAAAHGLGVVASAVGGNPEILPERCLVDADDPRAVAAALVTQARDLAARPGLGAWPDVAEMCTAIAASYSGPAR
ncbi:glycosyltransferase family 4 protein [Nocardioides bigeumensis]|uniref:glycosyltransferase family 4 protein n=1 Tax=Nocardioides bigeumensis TaxID=433657 RepID=UPI0031D86242